MEIKKPTKQEVIDTWNFLVDHDEAIAFLGKIENEDAFNPNDLEYRYEHEDNI